MGLDERDSIPSEEEVDREDSGEDYYPIAFRSSLDLFPEEKNYTKDLKVYESLFVVKCSIIELLRCGSQWRVHLDTW